jgi:hypothetical protein
MKVAKKAILNSMDLRFQALKRCFKKNLANEEDRLCWGINIAMDSL